MPVLYTAIKTLAEQVFGSRSAEDDAEEPPTPPTPPTLPPHDRGASPQEHRPLSRAGDRGKFTDVPLTPEPQQLPHWVEGESSL